MPIPQLNFGRTSVVDPASGALQGLTSARNTLSDTMGQWAKEEELARQAARQKVQDDRQVVLDDRATTEYDYKLAERGKAEEEAKKKQAYLNALASPGDTFADKNVQRSLMDPNTMEQMVNANPALTKAIEHGLESLTPAENIQYEEHFKQMDKLGQSPTEHMGVLDAADLYGVLGGEYGAMQSIEAQKALEKARNEGLAGLNKQETEMTLARLDRKSVV